MATPEQHAAAVKAVLTAGLTPKLAYDFDEIPQTRPSEYVEFSVTRRFGGEEREDGYVGTTGWRITTRYVARRVSDARLMQSKATTALEYVSLSIAGGATTGIAFESGDPIEPDDLGHFAGYDLWTYTL